jgi:IS5 family transposase
MRPKKHKTVGSNDLFRARLDQIINMKHELVLLASRIDWGWIDGEIAPLYSENGRPGIETRFMIGLLLLKHIYGLSDEGVCERWVHDPYFQFFTGEEFFQHAFPHERSDLSHWRKRLGDKLELLLAESLRVAYEAGALRGQDLKRVTIDTTVQPKAITFPTDAKLLHAAIKGLNRLARRHGVRLRQSYSRVAKAAAMMAGRYAHAKQFRRHQRQLRILRSRLGRIIRDIRRKIEGQPALEQAFALPLGRATQIRSQQQRQRGWKLYSFHAPEVECIGKGKAAAPYEFGVKASIVTNNCRAPGGLFVLHASALPDNPYDGHTLRDSLTAPRHSRAVRSSGPMSTTGTAATTHKIPVASSSPARSAASSVSSSASCAAAPPSSPSSDTSRLKVTSDAAISKAAQETPPTSSSQPWATTSAASSSGSEIFGALS